MVTSADAHLHTLVHDSRDAGLGDPPPEVVREARLEIELNHEVHKREKDWGHLAGLAAGIYDALNGTGIAEQAARRVQNDAQAEELYHELRRGLFPELLHWRAKFKMCRIAR